MLGTKYCRKCGRFTAHSFVRGGEVRSKLLGLVVHCYNVYQCDACGRLKFERVSC